MHTHDMIHIYVSGPATLCGACASAFQASWKHAEALRRRSATTTTTTADDGDDDDDDDDGDGDGDDGGASCGIWLGYALDHPRCSAGWNTVVLHSVTVVMKPFACDVSDPCHD